MFTLWYTVLSYKEYKNSIWDKLAAKKPPAGFKETAIVSPLSSPTTTEKNDTTTKSPSSSSRIPVVELESAAINKPPRNIPAQVPSPPVSLFPPISPILPNNKSPIFPPQKIEPPPKPPRSPSPHPIRSEAFANDKNIEYEEEEDEDEEATDESSEADDEENSVLAQPHQHQRSMINNKPVAKTVNEFINKEKAT